MTDQIAAFGRSKIQHGKGSDRVYLMHLASADRERIIPFLDDLATTRRYGKIFAKVPAGDGAPFLADGYRIEATIPGFFRGEDEALFLGKYFSAERQQEQDPELIAEVLEIAAGKSSLTNHPPLAASLTCRRMEAHDTPAMAGLYRQVFASYPFPIHDESYLRQTMTEDVIYFGIVEGGELLALASAEIDRHSASAEMTDFATRPDRRGHGLANHLLHEVERAAAQQGVKTAYTIARAYSAGMNITFARNGYRFSGTLTHNTQIFGALESMNVWYKDLRP